MQHLDDNFFSVHYWCIYLKEERLIVDADQEIAEIRLYDILGRQLMSDLPKMNSFQLDIEKIQAGSIFIVELKSINGGITTKKMVKYWQTSYVE